MQECIANERDFWGERGGYEPNIVVLDSGDAENTRKVSQTISDMGLKMRKIDDVLGTIEVEVRGGQEIEWECYFLNSDLPIGNAFVNMEVSFDV
ncbi:MAG: hypothetical protein NT001_00490 [Candidatus Woesearchaeota archaeon]|nr:hypothetical protein [Candidatus Woesearchaeota archaeon]